MRRTIYVGIGGAGVKAIEEVKNLFIHHNQVIPSEIQFLGIDTNVYELNNHSISGVEKIHLNVTTPLAHYRHSPESYDIPNQNINYLNHSLTTGSGAVRSNSNFMLQDDSLLNHDIEQRINLIYQNLCNVHNFVAPPYGHQIDVHICFSLCGGTGSGIYLDIIQKFRRIIPNANIICYAFSHIFYDHIDVNYFVKPNEYASLLEADLNKTKYQVFTELEKTFDTFFYISNSIKAPNEAQFSFSFDEVLLKVTKMLYYSAIGISPAHYAINDNLIVAENSGVCDQMLHTRKKAWVSSPGNSDIPFLDLYKIQLEGFVSLQLLHRFLGQETSQINNTLASLAKQIFDIDNDYHDLMNELLPSSHYVYIIPITSIHLNQNDYSIDDSLLRNSIDSAFDEMSSKTATILERLKHEFRQLITAALFPCKGETCGIKLIREQFSKVESFLKDSIIKTERLIENEEFSKHQKHQIEEDLVLEYRHEMNRIVFLRNRTILQNLENDIYINRRNLRLTDICICKLKLIIKILNESLDFIHIQTGNVYKLECMISGEIVNAHKKNKSELHSMLFCQRLDSIIHNVISSRYNVPFNVKWDWLLESGCDIDITSNHTHILDGIQKLIKEHSIVPQNFICEIVDAMSDDELNNCMRDLVFTSAPLLNINDHGYNIKIDKFFYLVIPKNASTILPRLITSLSNYTGGSVIDVILTDEEDRIMFCQQLGVIPPYFIEGVSKDGIVKFDPNSCEFDFCMNLERHNVSPFSKQSFEDIVLKGGFSLKSSEIKDYN